MLVANVRVHTAPDHEPVDLAEAKAHLRVDGSEEDSLIDALIVAARRQAELTSRRALVTRTLEAQLDCWPQDNCIELAYPPLQSVTSITYIDSAGASATLPSADYIVDKHSQPGRIVLGYGKSWPSPTLRPGAAITVRYVAGYGDAEDVPQEYKQAMLLLIGHFFEHREAVAAGVTLNTLPLGVEALLLIDRGSF